MKLYLCGRLWDKNDVKIAIVDENLEIDENLKIHVTR